jgi:hypothetical protein
MWFDLDGIFHSGEIVFLHPVIDCVGCAIDGYDQVVCTTLALTESQQLHC